MRIRTEADDVRIHDDDEVRLLYYFRCLTQDQQRQLLQTAGEQAMERCVPDRSVYEFMPTAGGIEPEKFTGNIWDSSVTGTIIEILRDGLEETGEPTGVLLGSSAFDEDEVVPRFAAGAQAAADRQGSFFKYDEAFALEYLHAWRWEIAKACSGASLGLQHLAKSQADGVTGPEPGGQDE